MRTTLLGILYWILRIYPSHIGENVLRRGVLCRGLTVHKYFCTASSGNISLFTYYLFATFNNVTHSKGYLEQFSTEDSSANRKPSNIFVKSLTSQVEMGLNRLEWAAQSQKCFSVTSTSAILKCAKMFSTCNGCKNQRSSNCFWSFYTFLPEKITNSMHFRSWDCKKKQLTPFCKKSHRLNDFVSKFFACKKLLFQPIKKQIRN